MYRGCLWLTSKCAACGNYEHNEQGLVLKTVTWGEAEVKLLNTPWELYEICSESWRENRIQMILLSLFAYLCLYLNFALLKCTGKAFCMFQLKCRKAVCIPKGKSCEIDTPLLSAQTLRLFALSVWERSCWGLLICTHVILKKEKNKINHAAVVK